MDSMVAADTETEETTMALNSFHQYWLLCWELLIIVQRQLNDRYFWSNVFEVCVPRAIIKCLVLRRISCCFFFQYANPIPTYKTTLNMPPRPRLYMKNAAWYLLMPIANKTGAVKQGAASITECPPSRSIH